MSAQHTPGPCRYRPKNPMLRATFDALLRDGESRRPNMGGLSNAYCTARDTGRMPSWCAPGTPSFAAAKAGLCRAAIAAARGQA